MTAASLSKIKKAKVAEIVGPLRAEGSIPAVEAAGRLIAAAREQELGLRDYLTLAIDPRLDDDHRRYMGADGKFLTGYEAALNYLGLPVRDDLESGIRLRLASDTFQTFPGTRALFPEVVDDMVRWKYRQYANPETVAALVAQSRTVSQTEMISTVVDDKPDDYREAIAAVAEGGNVPVYSIRTTQMSVKFWKFGRGIQVTYEFSRRASIDLLVPYAARVDREAEISKVAMATKILVDGDGVNPPAPVTTQFSLNDAIVGNAQAGVLSRKHLLKWLVSRAKTGTPVTRVGGNYDAYVQWLLLFTPNIAGDRSAAEELAAQGFQIGGVPILQGTVNFVLMSAMPANQLLGFSQEDTLEELVEANSLIDESQRAVLNQKVTYVKTENSGFRLVFGDTRSILDYSAAA